MGVQPDSIVPALNLLGQAPWTTKAVEDPHAVGHAAMKVHSGLSRQSLLPLCLLCQVAPLFRKCPVARALQRVDAQISRALRRAPQRVSGRHVFCRDLMALGAEQQAAGIRV
eukprot:12996174-Alexandrium_andersonii.AAC.1